MPSDRVITRSGDTFLVEWGGTPLRCFIDRFYEDSHFLTTAEWNFEGWDDEAKKWRHIWRDRINIVNGTGKGSLAKRMSQLRNTLDGDDWLRLVEGTSNEILERYREGDAPVVIGDAEAPGPTRWLIEDYLALGQPNAFFGMGGIGKSTVAKIQAVVIDQDLRTPLFRLGDNPGTVIYADWETDESDFKNSIDMIHKGFELGSKSGIIYRRCHREFQSELMFWQHLIAENSARLLVIDSAMGAVGGKMEDNVAVGAFFNALRALGITTLLVSHPPKNAKKPSEQTMYGSAYFYNLSRNIWQVIGSMDKASGKASLGLKHAKINVGSYCRPRGLEIAFTDDAITAKSADLMADAGTAQAGSVYDRCRRILAGGPQTLQQLALLADVDDPDTVRRTMARYPTMFRLRDDKYELIAHEPEGEQDRF